MASSSPRRRNHAKNLVRYVARGSHNVMFRLRSIFGYAILIGAVLLVFWASQHLDIPNVAVRRSLLGGILLVGLIAVLYFSASHPSPPTDRHEIEAWGPTIESGRSNFLLRYVFSGFKWFIPVLVIGLIHDYLHETSMIDNIGIYAAIALAWIFNFYLSGLRLWDVAETVYRAQHL
jgi:hypothetical protein